MEIEISGIDECRLSLAVWCTKPIKVGYLCDLFNHLKFWFDHRSGSQLIKYIFHLFSNIEFFYLNCILRVHRLLLLTKSHAEDIVCVCMCLNV